MLDPGGRLAGLQPAVWLFEFVAKRGLAFVQRRRAAAPAQQESDAMSDDQAEPDRDKADPMPDLHAFIRLAATPTSRPNDGLSGIASTLRGKSAGGSGD
jgi:hypothetical protein